MLNIRNSVQQFKQSLALSAILAVNLLLSLSSAVAQSQSPPIQPVPVQDAGITQTLFDPVRLGVTRNSVASAEQTLVQALAASNSQADRVLQAQTTCDLGLIHLLQGKLDDAQKDCSDSLVMRENIYGINSPPCADSLNALAAIALAAGDDRAAEQQLKSATLIEQRNPEINKLRKAQTLDLQAQRLVGGGAAKEAEPLAVQAYKLRSLLLGDTSPAAAQSMVTLSTIKLALGKPRQALSTFQKALDVNDGQLTNGPALLGAALVSMKLGNASQSERFFDRAVAAQSLLFGSTDKFAHAYRSEYLKHAWQGHHYLLALKVRQTTPNNAGNSADLSLDPRARRVVDAVDRAPQSAFGFRYDHRYLIVCASIVGLVLILTVIMLAAPDSFLTMRKARELQDLGVRSRHPGGEHNVAMSHDDGGTTDSNERAQQSNSGKLHLKPKADYIPKWDSD